MRRLLVASQKGGVGKTTTSVNLAAAASLAGARVLLLDADPLSSISSSLNLAQQPNRQPLRQAGVEAPGVLACNVLPGLDVLSPYEEGGCTDEDLGRLLQLLSMPVFQEAYNCLIVDTPPFLGANPNPLLNTCDEFLLVMRAEPLAARTLPAFLELVQRGRVQGASIKMRGILLTLADGESPGGRWERELRGRFGTRILPQVIPYDEEITRALLFGQIVSSSNRESPAAREYHSLVESLELAASPKPIPDEETGAAALRLAVAALKDAAAAASTRRVFEKPSSNLLLTSAPAAAFTAPEESPPAPVRPQVEEKPAESAPPVAPSAELERASRLRGSSPTHRTLKPEASEAPARPSRLSGLRPRPPLPTPNTGRPRPPSTPAGGSGLRPRPVFSSRPNTASQAHTPTPEPEEAEDRHTPAPAKTEPRAEVPAQEPAPRPRAPKPAPQVAPQAPQAGVPRHLTLLWFGVAILVGVGLRFLKLPNVAVPVLVGLGVAALVIFLLRNQFNPQEPKPVPRQAPKPANRPGQPAHGRPLVSRLEEVCQHRVQLADRASRSRSAPRDDPDGDSVLGN